jgi:hypothetical protein
MTIVLTALLEDVSDALCALSRTRATQQSDALYAALYEAQAALLEVAMKPRYSVIYLSDKLPKYRAETPFAITHRADDGITSIIATRATFVEARDYACHLNIAKPEDYS